MGARDYISLVREQAWLILGATVIGLLAAVALAVLTPRSYASAATFYVVSTNAGLVTASDRYSGAQLSADRVKSYSELLQGATNGGT